MDNKCLIEKMYEKVFNGHDLSCAGEFIHEEYIQHNPGVKDGLKGFIEAFTEHFRRRPHFHTEIKHLIAEGDFVVVHAHATGEQGDKGSAVVDIYRMRDGKAIEHWDILQRIPDEFVHQNGMF